MQNTNHSKTNVSSLNELLRGKWNLSITSMQMQSNFLVISPESRNLWKLFFLRGCNIMQSLLQNVSERIHDVQQQLKDNIIGLNQLYRGKSNGAINLGQISSDSLWTMESQWVYNGSFWEHKNQFRRDFMSMRKFTTCAMLLILPNEWPKSPKPLYTKIYSSIERLLVLRIHLHPY